MAKREEDGLEALAARVARATACEDLFGDLGDTAEARRKALAAAYRRLARVLHPDRHVAPRDKALAHAAFVRATELRAHAEDKIRVGTYGDGEPGGAAPPAAVVTSRRRTYVIGRLLARGDLADLFHCTYDERGDERRAIFKVVASAGDGDLLENEADVLRRLSPAKEGDGKFYRYLPRLLDTLVLDGSGGTRRRANVLPDFSDHVSLQEVIGAHPEGLDFRDVAWMYKRMLAALGFVHRRGVVHGAILPPHVLVHPFDHGARIVDWCYASTDGSRVRAVVKTYRALYAPEILARATPCPATDIYMATRCALALLGGQPATGVVPPHVPAPMARFLSTCLAPSPARRPDDAWKLHEELDELLRRLVGEPKYRPLAMPARA